MSPKGTFAPEMLIPLYSSSGSEANGALSVSLGRFSLGALSKRMYHHSHHLFFRRGLAGPDLKLPRSLVHEHLYTRNHCDSFFASRSDQRRINRVVDQIEDQPRIDLFRLQDRWLASRRACRSAWHSRSRRRWISPVAPAWQSSPWPPEPASARSPLCGSTRIPRLLSPSARTPRPVPLHPHPGRESSRPSDASAFRVAEPPRPRPY